MKRLSVQDLRSEFPDLEVYFDKFCEKYPEFDKMEMVKDLIRQDSVIWKDENFFAIGRPNAYHTKTTFLIEAAAGEGFDWLDNISVIEDDVKAWGFDEVEFYGRLGWGPMMKDEGYKPVKTVMRKTL